MSFRSGGALDQESFGLPPFMSADYADTNTPERVILCAHAVINGMRATSVLSVSSILPIADFYGVDGRRVLAVCWLLRQYKFTKEHIKQGLTVTAVTERLQRQNFTWTEIVDVCLNARDILRGSSA